MTGGGDRLPDLPRYARQIRLTGKHPAGAAREGASTAALSPFSGVLGGLVARGEAPGPFPALAYLTLRPLVVRELVRSGRARAPPAWTASRRDDALIDVEEPTVGAVLRDGRVPADRNASGRVLRPAGADAPQSGDSTALANPTDAPPDRGPYAEVETRFASPPETFPASAGGPRPVRPPRRTESAGADASSPAPVRPRAERGATDRRTVARKSGADPSVRTPRLPGHPPGREVSAADLPADFDGPSLTVTRDVRAAVSLEPVRVAGSQTRVLRPDRPARQVALRPDRPAAPGPGRPGEPARADLQSAHREPGPRASSAADSGAGVPGLAPPSGDPGLVVAVGSPQEPLDASAVGRDENRSAPRPESESGRQASRGGRADQRNSTGESPTSRSRPLERLAEGEGMGRLVDRLVRELDHRERVDRERRGL